VLRLITPCQRSIVTLWMPHSPSSCNLVKTKLFRKMSLEHKPTLENEADTNPGWIVNDCLTFFVSRSLAGRQAGIHYASFKTWSTSSIVTSFTLECCHRVKEGVLDSIPPWSRTCACHFIKSGPERSER
jgi:hypothetical protein